MEQERVEELAREASKLFNWQKTIGRRINMEDAVVRVLERHHVSTLNREGQPRKLILSELGRHGGKKAASNAARIKRMEDEAASVRSRSFVDPF